MTTCTPRAAWGNLLRRLHFYIGLFVGPFIFIAALSGTLYVATPQLENALYHHALYSESEGAARPLAEQIAVAEKVTGGKLQLQAVRPGLASQETTRVMYIDPALKPSENRAIFIDPVSLAVRGDMTVYGTSGILPFRQQIDYLHRSLLLGDVGRLYSELAASWMWIAALGGIALWFYTRPKRRINNRFQQRRRLHVSLGWSLLLGMLLFSATGLTWSQWAGGNVDKLRAEMNWLTPQVNTQLHGPAETPDPHAEHHGHHMTMPMPEMKPDLALYDGVLKAANAAGIDASKLEIRPAKQAAMAWTVTEIDRRWPTQVDAVAVDPATLPDRCRSHAVCGLPADGQANPLGRGFPHGGAVWPAKPAAAHRLWYRAVHHDCVGIPDVVDAPATAGGNGSRADAVSELAGVAAGGTRSLFGHQRNTGAYDAGNGL